MAQQRNNAPARQQQQAPARPDPRTEESDLKKDIYLDKGLFTALFGNNEQQAVRFMAEAFAAIRKNPDLMQADRRTLVLALGEAAVLDLSPDPILGECYLIPRWNKDFGCKVVDFQTGYKGLIKLMHRGSSPIDWIVPEVVRRGEHFRNIRGTDPKIEHEVPLEGEIDETDDGIIGAYCAVMLRGSTRPITRVVRRSKIVEAAERSGDPRNKTWSNVWRNFFEEMAMKTAVRRVAKYVPGADQAHQTLWREDERAAGRNPVLEQLRGVAGNMPAMAAPTQPSNSLDALVERSQQEPAVDRTKLPSGHPDAEPPADWEPDQ